MYTGGVCDTFFLRVRQDCCEIGSGGSCFGVFSEIVGLEREDSAPKFVLCGARRTVIVGLLEFFRGKFGDARRM